MLTVLFTILASSLDGFACGFVMGVRRIRITYLNLILMSVFPFLVAFFSMEVASRLLQYMDEDTSKFMGITLYFVLAIYSYVTTRRNSGNEAWMDSNADSQITGMEVVSTGLALSMDTLIVAMPLSFLGYSSLLCAFLFALCSGGFIAVGNVLAKQMPVHYTKNVSKLSWMFYLFLGLRRLF